MIVGSRSAKLSLACAKHKKGFTLTEIAIVLGIMGLILGAIWTAAASVYNNQRIAHANTAILQIVQNIRSLYGTTGSTTGLTVANLITASAVPVDLVNGATLNSPFPGGSTTIAPTGDGLGFEITMSGLSQPNCIALLTAVGGTSRDPGLTAAESGGAALTTPASVGSALTGAVTPAVAVAAAGTTIGNAGGCTSAGSSAVASFVFSLR